MGEEVSCYGHEKPDQLCYIPFLDRGVVHLLVFGMENFYNVGGTGLDFIPGYHDEPPGGLTWNLEDVINIVNSQRGICYAAHPEAHRDTPNQALCRVPWITEDYDLIGYQGLQIWNGKKVTKEDWRTQRDAGLRQWIRLLLEGRKVFIGGGSDAHGDFSRDLNFPQYEKSDGNAFGRVRTYVLSLIHI